MDAIEKRARELLAKQVEPLEVGGVVNASGDLFLAEVGVVQAIIAALTPPEGYVLVPVDSIPMQPVTLDKDGRTRFRENPQVRALLDYATSAGFGLNQLAMQGHSAEDRMQLAQLIGYSVDGYGTLSYVSDESYDEAARRAAMLAARPEVPGA